MRTQFQSIAAAVLLSAVSTVQASDGLLQRLEPSGYVNDFANVISPAYEARIHTVITELNQKTGAEIAVVTLQSLEGGSIDDFTNRLFAKWGIGQAGKDNGLMFLCAMQERKMRIEVGYGLEGAVPDSRAGVIRRDIITPHFKAGHPEEGILSGIKALSADVAQEYGLTLSSADRSRVHAQSRDKDSDSDLLWIILPVLSMFGLIIFAQAKYGQPERRGRYTWDGSYGNGSGSGGWGGGGGGFGGFGGGMSGGGGSSGGW